MVVSTIGDGSYMFGNPTPFHLVSRAAKLPTLTIICNNGRWQAVESATRVVYPDGEAAHAEEMPLVELQPSPEFTKVAEASDAWARPATSAPNCTFSTAVSDGDFSWMMSEQPVPPPPSSLVKR